MAFAEGATTEQGEQPYKYNGKELDRTHGLNQYDYSARYYDPAYGRFTTVDPLNEKYYTWSPYVYCMNNPINAIDPTGMEWTDGNNYNDDYRNEFQRRMDAKSRKENFKNGPTDISTDYVNKNGVRQVKTNDETPDRLETSLPEVSVVGKRIYKSGKTDYHAISISGTATYIFGYTG